MKNKILFKIIFLTLAIFVFTQGRAQITSQEARIAMGRGINLGNTLEPEQEGEWNNDPVQEYYFDMYKAAGFNTVRIPIRWDKHTETTSPFAVDGDWMNRIEEIVDWGLSRDLFVIINMHHEESFQNDYSGQKERYDSIWSQISVRFKGKSEKLFFEIMNEPKNILTQSNMDEFNVRVLGIIRKDNPNRIVIYSGKGWASSTDMINAAIPNTNDPYLMAYYHSYDPWDFAGVGSGTWGTQADVNEMVAQMVKVQNWSVEKNIPVFIGEFGAQRKCEYNSRMFYYATYVEQALAHDLAFSVWDDGGDFEVMLRKDSSWNDIKDVLIYTSDTSPTALKAEIVDDTVVQLTWLSRSNSKQKVQIEKRTLTTDFSAIAELESLSPTTYLDYDAVIGETSYYRVVDVYADGNVPSYPVSILRISDKRTPYLTHPIAIPGTLETEDYDIGGEMNTYHDTESENRGGAYRITEGVDIEARPEGGFQVGYVSDGEWMEYTLNVAKATTYNFTAYVASTLTGGKFQLEFPNKSSEIITTPNTGSWTTLDVVRGTVDLEAGEQIMRFSIKSANAFNIDKIVFDEALSVPDKKAEELGVFPNPASTQLNITFSGNKSGVVSLYNSLGQLEKVENSGAGFTIINIEDLKPGIYFLIAKSNSGLQKAKFVKQ